MTSTAFSISVFIEAIFFHTEFTKQEYPLLSIVLGIFISIFSHYFLIKKPPREASTIHPESSPISQ